MTSGVLGMSVRGQERERLYVSVSRAAAVSNSHGFCDTLPHEELPGFAFCPIHLILFNIPPQDDSIDAANWIDAAVKTAKIILPNAFGLLHFGHSTLGRFPLNRSGSRQGAGRVSCGLRPG